MASKRIYEEDINLNIRVNGNQAQKEIYELETANRKLKEEIKGWEKELKKVGSAGKGMGKLSQEYKDLEAKIKAANNTIAENNSKLRNLHSQLNITEMTMGQLRTRAQQLRLMLKNMVPGSDQYKKLNAELSEVNQRMSQLNNLSRAQSLSWSSAANWLNKYQTMIIGFAASITGLVFTFQKWIDYSGQLSDQQANVRKTTGMTKKEVDDLTKSISELNTRTSRINLLEIAEEGGRIGLAKGEIAEFVEVMDKAGVALGDTFTGGVSEVASVLGKLKFLYSEFQGMSIEESYNAIGSALNELGANGQATERNIAEFTTRVGSMQAALRPAADEAMALGAFFEESGIEAEIASRAYNIFLSTASVKAEKFAQVMGVSTAEVEKMINTNPTEFFIKFSESLQGLNPEGTEMMRILKELGINANGTNKILGAAADKNKRLRDLMQLSNEAMEEGTSLTNEFNIKNENLAAVLEKIQKRVAALTTSQTLMEWLENAVKWFAKLIGATEDSDGSAKKWRDTIVFLAKVVAVVTAALVSNAAALRLVAIWSTRAKEGNILYIATQKAMALWTAINTVRTQAWNVITNLMILNLKQARIAFRAMTAAMSTTPWGALAAVIGIVVSSLILFRKESNKAAEQQQLLRDAITESKTAMRAEKDELQKLLLVARDQTQSLENRQKAMKRINELSPEFLGNLTLEKLATEEATKAIDKYIAALDRRGKMDVYERQLQKIQGKKDDINMDPEKSGYTGGIFWGGLEESFEEIYEKSKTDPSAFEPGGYYYGWVVNAYGGRGKFKKKYEEYVKEIQQLEGLEQDVMSKRNEFIRENPALIFGDNENTEHGTVEFPEDEKKEKDKAKQERERRLKELLAENKRMSDELIQLKRSTEDEMFNIQEDSFRKQEDLLKLNHDRTIQDFKRNMVSDADIKAIEKERLTAAKAGDRERVKLLDELLLNMRTKNAEINNAMLQEDLKYQYAVGKLNAEYAAKALNERQKAFDDERKLREQDYQQELIDLGTTEAVKARLQGDLAQDEIDKIKTWEDAKSALKKVYQAKEIDEQVAHIKTLQQEIQTALETGDFSGFSLEFVSEEDKQKFLDTLDELKQKLLDLGLLKAELQNSGDSKSTHSLNYGMGGGTDLLGMTQDNWNDLINNLLSGKTGIEEMIAVVGLMQNAMQQYYAYVNAAQQRDIALFDQATEQKRRKLKKQLDNGVLSQEDYQRKIEKLEEQADLQRRKMEYDAAMIQHRQSIATALTNTALSVTNALATVKPFVPNALIMAGVAAAMGGLQVATITKNKPVRGFEEGYYGDGLYDVIREQDGKSFKAGFGGVARTGVVKKPSVFLAGERGLEVIIDNKTFRDFDPKLKYDLARQIPALKGYEGGFYGGMKSEGQTLSPEVQLLLHQNRVVMEALLNHLQENGIQAFMVMDFPAMRTFKEVEQNYNTHQNKNKV